MADVEDDVASEQPKKRVFKKFSYRGVDLDMSTNELVKLFNARPRRRTQRGEEPVKTHLRNMIIILEMIGSIIEINNGKTFNQIEVKPEMIGQILLAEFSISYKPVKRDRPGIGATHSSRFIPLQ
ncbi:40S ribosomal protein S15 [Capsicum annuum]|uniref:40S ribosomal protein S15 n=1 Tax=Capsicum annuum TaxID=4072 RepID=A0A2G3AKN0_CAPAN|nr:40S ribosomal protein S15 [Capsicum annuum]KAF3669505.1 40S ribosomal protein S15 [Capsicum annuum]PHT94804.1 40S ribosomal protein S15 [Capsicum annuum]